MELGIASLTDAELIGTGGFAVVYKAEQPAFRRTVAVKLLTVGKLDEATSHRFERECQLMGSLSEHPSIVTMLDAGFTDEGRPYLLMAYMPGGSLADRLAASGPLPWREAVPIGVRMAGALEVAHRADVVHRDVKPANILLSSFGEPQLTDFGIARIAGGPETRSGIITASMAHAAPEVIEGERPGVAADVYSLGSTLFALLAGEPAFTRHTDESVFPLLLRIRSDPVPDLRPRGVPDAVCTAVEAAMAKDPNDRPRSAVEFGEALRRAEEAAGLAPTSMLLGFETHPGTAETIRVGEPDVVPQPGDAEPSTAEVGEPATAAILEGVAPGGEATTADARRQPVSPPAEGGRRRWPAVVLALVLAAVVAGGGLVLLARNGDGEGGVPAAGEAQRLEPGRQVEGRLPENGVARFTFDGPEGIVAAVEMTATAVEADPYVEIFGPDGRLIAADDDLGGGPEDLDALAAFLMPVHGTYTIEARDRGGFAADYTLGVYFEAFAFLDPPVVTDGAFDVSAEDRHFYVILAEAGQAFEVLVASEQPGLDPYVEVYGPAEALAGNDDSGNGPDGLDAHLVFTAPATGSYRIVAGHSDQTGGRYRLEIIPVG